MRAAREFKVQSVFRALASEAEGWGVSSEGLWAVPWDRYRPHARYDRVIRGIRYTIEMNSRGYRTREFDVPKPPGTFRVACIGASTTVAGISNDTTYPALLETRLRALHPGRPIEVLNLGVSGALSQRWIKAFEELLSYQPDIVIQYNAMNDIAQEHLGAFGDGEGRLTRLLNRSLLYQRFFPLDPKGMDRLLEWTYGNFTWIGANLRARGIPYLLGTFARPSFAEAPPVFQDYLDADVELNWGLHMRLRHYRDYEALIDRFNNRLVEHAARTGIVLVPVHERISESRFFVDACHFSPEGIDRLAAALAPAVSAHINRLERGSHRRTSQDPAAPP